MNFHQEQLVEPLPSRSSRRSRSSECNSLWVWREWLLILFRRLFFDIDSATLITETFSFFSPSLCPATVSRCMLSLLSPWEMSETEASNIVRVFFAEVICRTLWAHNLWSAWDRPGSQTPRAHAKVRWTRAFGSGTEGECRCWHEESWAPIGVEWNRRGMEGLVRNFSRGTLATLRECQHQCRRLPRLVLSSPWHSEHRADIILCGCDVCGVWWRGVCVCGRGREGQEKIKKETGI